MISRFSVKKPFTIFVAVVVILVFGVISYMKMVPDLFPSINMPYAIVMTTYPGASPEEVESQITDPLEQQLASINNMKNITSTSNDSYSMIAMEFNDDVNMDAISVDIREKINLISGYWDDSVGEPVILKINPDMIPVTVASVSVEGKDVVETTAYVEENLLAKLEGIEGVASVSTTGMVSEDIQVILSQEKIDEINKKTSDAISAQFSSAESQIKGGIEQAEDGLKQIESGKSEIISAQQESSEQLETTRIQLNGQKEQALELKENVTELEKNRTVMSEMESALKKQYPSLSDAEIKEMCMQNSTYTDAAAKVNAIETALTAALGDANKIPSSEELNVQIESIDEALSDLNVMQSNTEFELNNSMSELNSNAAALNNTVSDLQKSLSEIQSQEEAAVNSANLTGILTMDNVSAILSAQNFSMPAGYVTDENSEIMVSVGNKITSVEEMKDLVLVDMGIDGLDPVKLSDIADVTYVDNAAETYAKINGENGVLLTFNKQSGYATAEVAEFITDEFAKLSDQFSGVEFTVLSDQGEYIHMVVDSVVNNLLLGALFAILILIFFLRDIRPTVITAVSIPLSVLFAIALMYFSGVTLNMISLSGLAVGVGMLVDNSIVVVENTYRLRTLGYNNIQSAISGASQVAGAITASTLTTICVFVPIVFIDGLTREIFTDMALTIAYSLLASLIIALTLVPALARGLLKKDTNPSFLSHDSKPIQKYRSILKKSLHHRKMVLVICVVLLLASCGAALARGFEYMPEMASTELSVTIQMPEDSELKDTAAVSDAVSSVIMEHDEVETVGSMLASDSAASLGISTDATKDVTAVTMYVLLKEGEIDKSKALIKDIEALGEEYGCEITAAGTTDIMSLLGGSGVTINIYNEDLDSMRTAGLAVEKELRNIKGLTEVSDLKESSTPKLNIEINKNEAMSHGLTVAQIYAEIAATISAEETATALVKNGENTDVVISNEENTGMTKKELSDMEISVNSNDGEDKTVRLSDVAEITEGESLSSISHDAQKRVLTVSADVKENYNVTHVTNDAEKAVEKLELPAGTKVEFQGENETIMEAMRQMLLLLVLGILLVYLVMVAQFQSLRSPFIVMFTVPLAFTGGMIALIVTGFEVSVVSMIGFVMLVGIIVNNGIVLVDCINRFRLEDGLNMHDAIVEASIERIRPVLMTALTTILGLMPMALGFGDGAEMVQPVAVVSIGGLLYATLMTLIVVPIMYSYLSKKEMRNIDEKDMVVVDA